MPDEVKDFSVPETVTPSVANPFATSGTAVASSEPVVKMTATDEEIDKAINETVEFVKREEKIFDEPKPSIDAKLNKIGSVLRNRLDGRQFVQAMTEIGKILSEG